MTVVMKNLLPKRNPITDPEIEAHKGLFKIDNEPSKVITAGNAFYWQFWVHTTLASATNDKGETVNLYSGFQNGPGQYPLTKGNGILDPKGYFRIQDGHLPATPKGGTLVFDDSISDPFDPALWLELGADDNRINENPKLKALHLVFALYHNRRMEEHGDFERAKLETIAAMNHMTLNEGMLLTGIEDVQDFMNVRVHGWMSSKEFNFGFGRWAHAQMRPVLGEESIFTPAWSGDIPVAQLFNGTQMARELNLGISPDMADMASVDVDKNIIDRTSFQAANHSLATWSDLTKHYQRFGIKSEPLEIDPCLMWFGILMEAERDGNGRLGPVGARAVADAIAESLSYADGQALGIYYPNKGWNDAPTTTLGIINYALHGEGA